MKNKFTGIFLALSIALSAMLCGCGGLEEILGGIEINVETTAEGQRNETAQSREEAVSGDTEIRETGAVSDDNEAQDGDTAAEVQSTEAVSDYTEVQTQSADDVQTERQAEAAVTTPAQTTAAVPPVSAEVTTAVKSGIEKDGSYTSPEDVAEYIHTFGTLPGNFITKKEAQALGWDNKAGNLWEAAPGKSIGGDYFGNYEGLLPEAEGRKYTECDVNYDGGYRGSERIIFSNDGLIYYTNDHYKSFTPMYGEE